MSWEMWLEVDLNHFDIRKIYVGALESQFGVQKRPISVSYELNWAIWSLTDYRSLFRLGNSLDGPFFWSMSWEMWLEVDLKHFRQQKNICWGSRKSIRGKKRPILVRYALIFVIWGLFRLGNSLDWPFFWSMSSAKILHAKIIPKTKIFCIHWSVKAQKC